MAALMTKIAIHTNSYIILPIIYNVVPKAFSYIIYETIGYKNLNLMNCTPCVIAHHCLQYDGAK